MSAPTIAEPATPASNRLRWLWEAENVLVALALAVLMLLPLIEIVGRKIFQGGISGSAAFQQHLVLIIGLLGGMFAARDRRLLALSTLTTFLKGRWLLFARVFSSAFAAGNFDERKQHQRRQSQGNQNILRFPEPAPPAGRGRDRLIRRLAGNGDFAAHR